MKHALAFVRFTALLVLLAGAGMLALADETAEYEEARWTPEARGIAAVDDVDDPTRRGRTRDNRPWWEGNSGSDDDSGSSSGSSGKSGSDGSGKSGMSSSDSSSDVSPTDPDDDSSSD